MRHMQTQALKRRSDRRSNCRSLQQVDTALKNKFKTVSVHLGIRDDKLQAFLIINSSYLSDSKVSQN
jgi:hypothetical protein